MRGSLRLSNPTDKLIDGLYRGLMVDQKWSVRRKGGFSWWSYRLAQHVSAGVAVKLGNGEVGYPVHIWTEVVRDVKSPDAALAMVSSLNTYASMSALVWRPEGATIHEEMSAVVFAGTVDDWVRTLSIGAVLQNAAAHSRCLALSEAVHGSPAVTKHPGSGERLEMDDILNVPKEVIAPAGKGRSKFADEMLRRLPDFDLHPWLMANGTDTGFTAEFECTSDVTAAQAAGRPELGLKIGTALLQVFTEQDHPALGSGALLALRLPPAAVPEGDPGHLANYLNTHELGANSLNALGAWCKDPVTDGNIAHITFLPSILAHPGLLENFTIYSAMRARWAASALAKVRPGRN